MADDDLTVRFGADTSELDAAIALAKVELAALNDEVSSLAKAMTDAGQQSQASLVGALQEAAGEARGLKTAIADAEKSLADLSKTASRQGLAAVADEMSAVNKEFKEASAASAALAHAAGLGAVERALADVGKSAEVAAVGFGSAGLSATYLTRETRALLDEAAAGRWRQFDGTVVNVATHFAQLAANFAVVNPLVTAAGVAAVAAGGYFAYLAYEMEIAAQEGAVLKNALAFSGQTGLSDADIAEVSARLDKLRGTFSGLGKGDVDKIEVEFSKIPAITKDMADAAVDAIKPLSDILQIKMPEAAKIMQQGLESPKEGLKSLADLFGDTLTPAVRDEIKAAQDSLDPHKQQAAFLDVVAEAINRTKDKTLEHIDALIAQRNAQIALNDAEVKSGGAGAGAALESNRQIREIIAGLDEERRKIEAARDASLEHARAVGQISSSVDELRTRFDDVLKSIAPWTTELEKAQGAIAALRAGLQGSTGDAAALVRQFEVFKDKAYLDSDGKYRVGFGSDTTTDASGQKHEVTSETTTTREDAERDLARRIVEFQTEAARQIGPAWARLTDEAKASITSVAYNYGHVPGSVVTAAQTGGNAEIAGAIGALSSNPGRRAQEAANITHIGGAAITDPEKVRQGTEAIAEQQDKILALNQAKSGGTEIEKAQVANLQAELAGRKDDIAATERLIEATQRQLALTSSAAERAKLTRDIDADRVTLQGQQNAAKEAELRLGIGEAQGKGDVAGQRDAEVALATFKMSLYGQDTAEYRAALGEKEAADRQYANTQKQVAMDGAQADIKSIQSATAAKIRGYDEDYHAHLISEQQKVAATDAVLATEIAKERDILNQELALDNLRPPERKKALDELAQLEQTYAQQVKQLQTEQALTLKSQQNAAEEARLHLAVGQAEGTGDAKGQHDAAVALAQFKMSLYGQDTAEYQRALGEKEAADRQYAATQTQLAMDSAQKTVKSAESTAQALIKQYDTDAKAHAITEQEKLQKTQEALNAEVLQQEVALAAEANLENLRPKQRQDVLEQMLKLEQDYAQKVKQLQTEQAEAALKAWQSFFAPMNSAINGFISEVVSGHETIRTALAKTLEKMTADLIKFFADWMLRQAELVVAHVAGNAAIQASDQASTAGSLASMIANAIKAIAAGAGQTAAGVSGFLAPVLGPAAPAAGLAAGASIEAGALGIGMMDIGAYDVPSNQLAMVHKNELVMPAPQAGAFRSMLDGAAQGGGSGGGDTHNHNWNISGAQSPIETAKAVAKIWKDNFSLRPKY